MGVVVTQRCITEVPEVKYIHTIKKDHKTNT